MDLPLVWREDGTVSADGGSGDFLEICWDLRLEMAGDQVLAWHFNPDDPAAPCRFGRTAWTKPPEWDAGLVAVRLCCPRPLVILMPGSRLARWSMTGRSRTNRN